MVASIGMLISSSDSIRSVGVHCDLPEVEVCVHSSTVSSDPAGASVVSSAGASVVSSAGA